jgi:hypothetical protein
MEFGHNSFYIKQGSKKQMPELLWHQYKCSLTQYAKILKKLIDVTAEHISSNAQYGFMMSTSCSDCIFMVSPLKGKWRVQLAHIDSKRTFIFTDYEKASNK